MLLILLLRNPHLMESTQTSQDTTTNPRAKTTLGGITRCGDTHARTGEELHQLVVQTIRESVQKTGSTGDDNIGKQVRSDIDVDAAQGSLDQFGDGLGLCGSWDGRVGIRDGSLDVEEGLDDAEAVDAEDLVVAVWELEGTAGRRSGHFFVRSTGGSGGRELVRSWPDLDDTLLEFGESAFLEEGPVAGIGGLVGGVCPVLGLRGLAGFDGGLGADQVVRGDGDGLRRVLFKQGADLGRDVVAAKRGVLHAALEDHAVVNWGDGDVGGANVDDQGGRFAGREAV